MRWVVDRDDFDEDRLRGDLRTVARMTHIITRWDLDNLIMKMISVAIKGTHALNHDRAHSSAPYVSDDICPRINELRSSTALQRCPHLRAHRNDPAVVMISHMNDRRRDGMIM